MELISKLNPLSHLDELIISSDISLGFGTIILSISYIVLILLAFGYLIPTIFYFKRTKYD